MGGAQSFFNETDWDLADGALRTCDETMDGRPPTTTYQTYDLVKRSIVANQRELDITDSEKNLLFHVRPSPGTIAGFDVLGVGSANNDDYILRVTVDLARRYWIIYRFDKPIFDGQKPDPIATEKFAIEQQTSVTNERKELAARISASLAIHSFSDDTPVDEVPPSAPIVPKHFLYKVGCVTVSWSRYMAVAAYYGPPTIEQIMHATEAACKQEMKSKKPTTSNDTDDGDDDGDILSKARKIAGRLREEREGMDESERSEKAATAALNTDAKDVSTIDVNGSQIAETNVEEGDVINVSVAAQPSLENKESIKGTKHKTEIIETHDAGRNRDGNTFSARQHSLADDLGDESESDIDQSNDNPHEAISEALSHQEEANNNNINPSGNDSLDIQASASMPDLSHPEKSASPRIIANGLQKWWQDSSRTLHEKSIAMLRPKGMSEDFTSTTTTSPGMSGPSAPLDISGSSKHSGNGSFGNESGVASFLGIGKTSTVDDPLQGVVHLDKPLLLCQEIYTRIIGNHQTSKVSKEKVLTLLRQDMEQHLQNRKDDDEIESTNNDLAVAVNTDSLSLTQSEDKGHQDGSAVSELNVTAPLTDVEVRATSATPSEKVASDGDNSILEPTPNNAPSDEVTAASSLDATPPKEQPLVGYWVWENTLRTHKMKMHLAKGSDLALHIVLAVLVNQLRYERNAIAMAV